jgi:hypothetical protein
MLAPLKNSDMRLPNLAAHHSAFSTQSVIDVLLDV